MSHTRPTEEWMHPYFREMLSLLVSEEVPEWARMHAEREGDGGGADAIQDWVCQRVKPDWATGIGAIEAAESMVWEAISNGNINADTAQDEIDEIEEQLLEMSPRSEEGITRITRLAQLARGATSLPVMDSISVLANAAQAAGVVFDTVTVADGTLHYYLFDRNQTLHAGFTIASNGPSIFAFTSDRHPEGPDKVWEVPRADVRKAVADARDFVGRERR